MPPLNRFRTNYTKCTLHLALVCTFVIAFFGAQADCSTINSSFTASQTNICGVNPTTINFTNTSTGTAAASIAYTWYLNGTSFSTTTGLTAPASSTINVAGTYTYMLVAYDATVPCYDTAIIKVNMYPSPIANYTFTNNMQCTGTTISFTNTSTGTIGSSIYNWNFGDGTSTTTNGNPTHTYTNGGSFNVVLTVTNAVGCTNTSTQAITVLSRPIFNIAGDDGDGNLTNCLPQSSAITSEVVNFTNVTTPGDSYSWDFGDGTTTINNSSSFTHTYSAYGAYPVVVTATAANGCTSTKSLQVIFALRASSSFTVSTAELSGCVPHSIKPNNTSLNAISYIWDFGDGSAPITTSVLSAPNHIYTGAGSFSVILTTSNFCGSSTFTYQSIVVDPLPNLSFSTTLLTGCAPQMVSFTNTSTGASPANNYNWNFGNGTSLTGIKFPPAQTYHQGTYEITLSSANACGKDTIRKTIIIDSIPHAIINCTPTEGCSPLTVSTINTSTGGNLTYQWFIDGTLTATSATLPNQLFTLNTGNIPVTHSIRLVATNHCGTDDTTITIKVHPRIAVNLNPLNTTICEGQSITFTQTSQGDQLTYAWDFGNGTTNTNASPPPQSYPNAGNYNAILTVSGYCNPPVTVTANIVVNPTPIAPTSSNDTICAGKTSTLTASVSGNTYQWYDAASAGNLLFSGSNFTTSPLTSSVDYYVQSSISGCAGARTKVHVEVNPVPIAPSAQNHIICLGETVTLTATAPGGTYSWYDFPSAGTVLASGSTYAVTPASNTVYYLETTIKKCSSPRTPVTVTVNPSPLAVIGNPVICENTSFSFNNLTTTPTIAWDWDFGDGTAHSTTQNPTHTYTGPGIYTVTFTASAASNNCANTTTKTVTVNPVPGTDFTFINSCAKDSIHLSNTSTGNPDLFTWNFGDGTSSNLNQSNPAHLYGSVGSYLVTLTASYSSTGCSKSNSHTVIVNPRTIPGFKASTECLHVSTAFTDTSKGSPTQTTWNFGDGSPNIIANNPAHTYGSAGSYIATLITQNVFGCIDSVKKSITVNPLPIPSFKADTVCLNLPTTFTNNTTNIVSSSWDFGDGSPVNTGNSPAHIYASAGTYTAKLTAFNQYGCKDTISHKILVHPNPVADFTVQNVCDNSPVNVVDNSTSALSWSWNFGDGSPLTTIQNPTHNYAQTGNYAITLTVKNSYGCTDMIAHTVDVYPKPKALFNVSNVCAGQKAVFSDLSTGSSLSWFWNFKDGNTSTIQNPTNTYTNAGTYLVTLVVTGSNACKDSVTKPLTINPVPVTNFSFVSVCAKDSLSFTSTSTGNPDTFVWDFGDGSGNNSNLSSIKHLYTLGGTYSVILTSGYSLTGCSSTSTQTVNVYPRTIPGFKSTVSCYKTTTQFTDTTKGLPTQWIWDFGDNSLKDFSQNPTHLYSASGNYTVKLITKNSSGCLDSITGLVVVNTLPVANFTINSICENTLASFNDQSTDAVAWTWDFGDGSPTSNSNSPQHLYTVQGAYTIKLAVLNQFGCKDSISHVLVVNPNPVDSFTVKSFCYSYPTSFSHNYSSDVSWDWDFGDGVTLSNINSPEHTYSISGNYIATLNVTNVFGCSIKITKSITILPRPSIDFTMSNACAKHNVVFTETVNDASVVSYNWNFGDGSTSSIHNPTHSYLLSGSQTITLIAKNKEGCADTLRKTLTVNSVPIPKFSANVTCVGMATSFVDLSTDVISLTNWFYNFDDGNSSYTQSPSYIYALAGTYNVSLTVTNSAGCDSTIKIPVKVNQIPIAKFSADTVCMGSATTFTDLSTGNPNYWEWDFGDGSISQAGPVTTHVYATQGTFMCLLTVKVDSMCSAQFYKFVYVSGEVKAGIKANGFVCVNGWLHVEDSSKVNSGTIATSTWDFGDGSPIEYGLNTDHPYSAPGIYYITHSVTSSAGCTSVIKDSVRVYPLPKANFTMNTACISQPSIFTNASSSDAITWDWYFGDNSQSSLQNPTHTYTNSGTFTVSLVISTAQFCFDSIAKQLVVHEKPKPSFTTKPVCWGDTTRFINTSSATNASIVSSQWDFSDGFTSTLTNPNHVFIPLKDSFKVSLIVMSSFGCVDSLKQTVKLFPLTIFNYGPLMASGCDAFTAQFQDNSTVPAGAVVNWLWDFGDGNFTYTRNPTHTYTKPGNYTVSLLATNSYGCVLKDTLNYPVIVYPRPVAGFAPSDAISSIYEPEIKFNNLSIGASMWDWTMGDFSTSIEKDPIHTYKDTGLYTITQIAINKFGCRDTVKQQIKIYGETTLYIPNAFTPNGNGVNDLFMPKADGIKEFEMEIFDRWGVSLFKTNDLNNGWNGRVNGTAEAVQEGVYVFKITTLDILNNNKSYVGNFTLLR